MEPYSQAIGRFVRGLSIDDIPQAVVDKAKLVLLDTIGVALASSTMQFGAMVTRVAQAFGGSPNRSCSFVAAPASRSLLMKRFTSLRCWLSRERYATNSTRRLIIPDTSRVT